MRNVRVLFVAPLMVVASLVGPGTGSAQTTAGWVNRAVDREVPRLPVSTLTLSSARQQSQPQKRNWIQRHPALFGALVGFGGGFFLGYLPGDDAVFDDFDASFNGLVIGGVGALAGAIVGEVTVD